MEALNTIFFSYLKYIPNISISWTRITGRTKIWSWNPLKCPGTVRFSNSQLILTTHAALICSFSPVKCMIKICIKDCPQCCLFYKYYIYPQQRKRQRSEGKTSQLLDPVIILTWIRNGSQRSIKAWAKTGALHARLYTPNWTPIRFQLLRVFYLLLFFERLPLSFFFCLPSLFLVGCPFGHCNFKGWN